MEPEWDDPDKDKTFRTTVPPWVWPEYFTALGRFMHFYARTEVDLAATISNWVKSRVQPRHPSDYEIIGILLGGGRFKTLRDTLKRLMRVTKTSRASEAQVDIILNHLGEIQFLRDRLAHNGGYPYLGTKEGLFSISNGLNTREFREYEVIYFRPSDLDDASWDLERIPSRLMFALDTELEAKVMPHPVPENSYAQELKGPWRYKPSTLKREGPKHQPSRRSHSRPHQSSRE